MNSTLMHADDSSNGAAEDKDAATIDCSRLMAEFSIVHGGRYYYYDVYRYERLADAVAYAQLVQGGNDINGADPAFARTCRFPAGNTDTMLSPVLGRRGC